MKYEKFIKTLKGMPRQPAPDKIWVHIEHDLKIQQHPAVLGKLLYFFPRFALVGAAAAVLVMALVSYSHKVAFISYINNFSSTEYIYENCRYPG